MKKLEELSLKEHTDLKRSGLMGVAFPEATGDYQIDCIPEPEIDLSEERFEKWWNENLSSQPPLINPNDSPQMVAKKYCRIGFLGCYHELQKQSE